MQLNPIATSETLSTTKSPAKPVETGTTDKSTATLQDDKVTISGESEPTYQAYGSGGVDIPDPPKEK